MPSVVTREFNARKLNTQKFKLILAVGTALLAGGALAADDLPIAGTYTQDEACKGDGSDPSYLLVKITPKDISYASGVCSIDHAEQEANKTVMRVTCKFLSGAVMGSDISFTARDAKTLDMAQQDGSYKAVLHRCPG
jgi:hypothetical protein